ncbi:hypothetical protein [Spirillospora sp. CA-294931]|uniref:hypothetical protein n=1 Tax=Spirillospora sp. CA-294931 TaxID=3240042 RepID=UPI003D8A8F69
MAFAEDYQVLGNKRARVRQLGNAVTPPAAPGCCAPRRGVATSCWMIGPLLNETVDVTTALPVIAVLVCVALTQRTRVT